MTTNITELAQSLKAAAIDAKELAIIARYSKGRAAAEKFYALANPNNVIALVEALEKSEKTSEARREAIDRAHNMFVRERDRANAAEEALEKAQKRIDELLPSSGNMLMPALEGLSRDHLLVTTQTAVDNYSVLHTKWLEDRQRIAELDSRTVKLPPKVDSSNIPFAGHTWNCCLDEVEKRLAAAGIKVEAE